MVAVAGLLLACGGGSHGPVADAGDLVSRLDLATVRHETRLIDLGTAPARDFLDDGWSWEEAAGGDAVWGVGKGSVVRFFLAAPRDLSITLRGAGEPSPAGEAQRVRVEINGGRAARFDLGPEPREHELRVPAERLTAGWNRLELRYRHWLPGQGSSRRAARWDWLRFGEGEGSVPPVRADTAAGTLFLPFGTQVEYLVRLADGAGLRIAELASPDGEKAVLEVLLEPEGADLTEVARLSPGRDLRIELGAGAGVARLVLRSVGDGPAAGLTLRRPRLDPVANPDGRDEPPRPNVFVYLIDALRADHVGAYGYDAATTPNIDRFAAEALRFEDAIAQSSWTKPTVASLFTGMLPPSHGVLLREHALPERATTLAEVLLAAGYRTAGFSTNPFVSRSFGLDQGFLDFTYLDAEREGVRRAFSDRVNGEVFRWLDERPDRPFFLYVHTIDPHAPYTPPRADGSLGGGEAPPPVPACREQQPLSEAARRDLVARYDEEIAFNDASFGRFVAELRRRDLYDDSVIVLLSDHGEAFWEHRGWRHENFLYSEVLDIPLIVKPPRGAARAATDGLAQQVDVLPTLLDLLRLPVPGAVQGRSLLAGGDSSPRAGFAFLECPSGKRLAAVLAGPWKLIRTLAPDGSVSAIELYHRRRDPAELRDQAADQPEVVRRLLTLLDAQEATRTLEQVRVEVGGDLEESLRALGYVD